MSDKSAELSGNDYSIGMSPAEYWDLCIERIHFTTEHFQQKTNEFVFIAYLIIIFAVLFMLFTVFCSIPGFYRGESFMIIAVAAVVGWIVHRMVELFRCDYLGHKIVMQYDMIECQYQKKTYIPKPMTNKTDWCIAAFTTPVCIGFLVWAMASMALG